MRPILILSALALLYHWAFGLPSFGSVQQHLAKTGILVAPDRDARLVASQATDRGGLHVPRGHDFSVPWKKRIVAVGGARQRSGPVPRAPGLFATNILILRIQTYMVTSRTPSEFYAPRRSSTTGATG